MAVAVEAHTVTLTLQATPDQLNAALQPPAPPGAAVQLPAFAVSAPAPSLHPPNPRSLKALR